MTEAELANVAWWAWLWGVIEQWAFFGVIVALAIEFAALKAGAPYKEKLESARELQIAELKKETTAAQLELAKLKAPRTISSEQRVRISELMHQFAGQEYWGMVASDVGDAWALWREISVALEGAGWKRLPPVGLAATQYGPPAGIAIAPQEGVMILFAPSSWAELRPRAQALANVLTEMGVLSGFGAGSGSPEKAPNAIVIIIGPKPQK